MPTTLTAGSLPNDPAALRGCVRDLIALSALPALWANRSPRDIAEGLAELLVNTLRLDFAYIALRRSAGEEPIEAGYAQEKPLLPAEVRQLGQQVSAPPEAGKGSRARSLPDLFGHGSINVETLIIGYGIEWGTAVLGSHRADFPNDTDRLLAGVGTNQAAIALQSGSLVAAVREAEGTLRQQSEILATLNRLGQVFAAELELDHLVQAVTDAATRLTGAQFGAFFYNVVNARGEAFTLYTLSGAAREAFERFDMPRNTPMFHPTFHGTGVVRSGNVREDPRYGQWAPHYGVPPGHLPVVSYLAVPVVARSGEVMGGLFFGHKEADQFGERDEQLVVGMAAQAAIAIENARLYHRERQARRTLEEGVRERTAELETANTHLARSREALRQLSTHLQDIREQERKHMAREIHDELGQELTGLKMDIMVLRRSLTKHEPKLLDNVDQVIASVDTTIQTVRRLATELRPGILDDFGLPAAIEWQLEEFERRAGIHTRLDKKVDLVNLAPDSRTAVFRIFQETLTNVARHANATEVAVELEERDGCLRLCVHDNGRGITDEELAGTRSLGLLGMRERVRLLAGEIIFAGVPGKGTRVLVTVPLLQQ
jgi:signal transduction histidine kinase